MKSTKLPKYPRKTLNQNSTEREINASLFAVQLNKSLEAYRDELKSEEWDSQIWKNAREKMKSIVKNCK